MKGRTHHINLPKRRDDGRKLPSHVAVSEWSAHTTDRLSADHTATIRGPTPSGSGSLHVSYFKSTFPRQSRTSAERSLTSGWVRWRGGPKEGVGNTPFMKTSQRYHLCLWRAEIRRLAFSAPRRFVPRPSVVRTERAGDIPGHFKRMTNGVARRVLSGLLRQHRCSWQLDNNERALLFMYWAPKKLECISGTCVRHPTDQSDR
jgi:hypothetical protein